MEVVYGSKDLIVLNDFLDNPDTIRDQGINAAYMDVTGELDGVTYKRVAIQTIPEVVEKLEQVIGRPIELYGMGFRLNYEGEVPNNEIHADLGWGTYAAVVYLSEPPEGVQSGTAFWVHDKGHDRVKAGQVDVLTDVQADWNDVSKWEQTMFVSAKFNSAIIYRGELFHSRWPFEAFGTTPANGRLIVVVFFS
jgi:uncharacterized protein DUF6445